MLSIRQASTALPTSLVMGAVALFACVSIAVVVPARADCVWRGTAPFCDGACNDDETLIKRERRVGAFGKEGEPDYGAGCVSGFKALCCTRCPEGLVYRDSYYLDKVCVTPAERDAAQAPPPPKIDAKFAAFCNRYASDAVEQAKKNLELLCGLQKENPSRWTLDREYHFNWCVGFNGADAEPNKEASYRVAGLMNCTAVIQGPGKFGDIIKETPPPVGGAGTGPAPTPQPQTPAGGQTATVIADVDVYQLAGGGGKELGVLYSNNSTTKVSLVEPCQNNWFHVKGDAVPDGQGWVYSGKGGGDYKSLDLEPCQ